MEETKKTYKYNPKPEFELRINSILKDEKDRQEYWKIVHTEPQNTIRVNALKMNPSELKKRLELKGWKINQPYKEYPEILIIENSLLPGELGRAREHLLGYYYVQEISSMMPLIALKPDEDSSLLDLCASPGSKTTQAAAMMNNKGILFANDNKLDRMIVLASNLEKCGVTNCIVTLKDGMNLCSRLKKKNLFFDKILVDAQCSGEGTLRSTPQTFIMWNQKMINVYAKQQKALVSAALEILKIDGELLYSTCTHAPEENEEIIQYLLDNYNIEIQEVNLPLKTREGITEWQEKRFSKEIKKCVRIYPQDNDTEGFFLCKIKKLGDKN